MKRIKKILIGIFFSLLLIPRFTNNVYAETINIALSGHTSVQTVNNYSGNSTYCYSDFIDVTGFDSVTLSGTISSDEQYGTTSVTLSIISASGQSTSLGGIKYTNANFEASGGPYAYTRQHTADISAYKGLYKFQVECHADGGGTKNARVNSLSALSIKPSFQPNSYVQSNGNLTRPCAYIVFV